MNTFKDKYIEQLFKDQRFSPLKQKLKMLETAEQLAELITPGQEYPFEFVCYKITGFRPQSLQNPHLIDSETLFEDIICFILSMSKTISQPVQMINEPVYTVRQAAEELGVSEKTVNRWRKTKLISRSLIFENGKRKAAILQSSLDNFLNRNRSDAVKSRKFTRLDNSQRKQIADLAIKLAQENPDWSRQALIRRLSEKTGRAEETVRYTLINSFGGKNRQGFSPAVLTPHQAASIYKEYINRTPVKELMSRYNRSRSSIYRIINQQKAKLIDIDAISWIHSEEFDCPENVKGILNQKTEQKLAIPSSGLESISADINRIKDIPTLNRDQELELFRLYNCAKFEAVRLYKQGSNKSQAISKVNSLLRRAERIKNVLVCANLRLVAAVARNHINRGATFSELLSEGTMALMRAVERFDYKKGFRFSTYASWAITRSFAAAMPEKAASVGDNIENIDKDIKAADSISASTIERAGEDLDIVISKNLTQREQYIIRNHYGLDGSLIRKNFKTMKQIGEDLGISGERVRQIELQALQKLRHCLSSEKFDELLK